MITFVALIAAGRVCADPSGYFYRNASEMKGYTRNQTEIRIAFSFANGTLLICAAATLATEMHLSTKDRGGASSTSVAILHCLGIAVAATLCGIIGGTDTPLLVNRDDPRIFVSLDVFIALWLFSYVVHMLRELLGSLVPPGTGSERGSRVARAWRRFVLETRTGAWVEFLSITAGIILIGASRLSSRPVAATLLALGVCFMSPALISSLVLSHDAYVWCGHAPLVQTCGLVFFVVISSLIVGTTTVEITYQVCVCVASPWRI